jgi:hypothetical protein
MNSELAGSALAAHGRRLAVFGDVKPMTAWCATW